MCLIGLQDPRNHYMWSNEETIVHMHDLNQPCSIYSVQRCKSVKSFASSLQYNLSDQSQFDVCFFINQILFSYQMLCFRDLLVGSGFFYAIDGLAYTKLFSHLLPYQEVQCITWLCLTLSLHLNGISKIFIVNDRSTEYINKNSSLMSAKVDYELQTKDLKIAFNRLHDK